MTYLTRTSVFQGNSDLVAAILLSLLTTSVLFGQHYRKEPAWHDNGWHDYEQSLVNSDTLTNVDLVRQLSSGQVALDEWVTASAPYWITEIFPAWVLMTLTGDDWRLTLALYSVVMCLLVIWSLAVVVRQASGLSLVRSLLAAALAVASLVALVRLAGSWSGNFGMAHRPFNAAAFFFACAGLAKVVAGGRSSVPLTWAYLACCLAFGVSDALLGVHVALPVFLSSLWWLYVAGGAEARKTAACAALGMVLLVVGFLANGKFSPFLDNHTALGLHIISDAVDATLPMFYEGEEIAGFSAMLVFMLNHGAKWLSEVMWGDNILNSLLVLSVVPLCAWAVFLCKEKKAQNQSDLKACTGVLLVVMILSLIAGSMAVVLFLYHEPRYLWLMFWAPFLSLVALVVAWDMSQGGKRIAYALTGLVVFSLAVNLAFFRHEDVASQRVVCSTDSLAGSGFERGMVSYWHAREVAVIQGQNANHVVYRTSSLGLESYPHAGNIRHNLGSASYAVSESLTMPSAINNFKRTFGLPSRISACDVEIYFLYGKNRLNSGLLARRAETYASVTDFLLRKNVPADTIQ